MKKKVYSHLFAGAVFLIPTAVSFFCAALHPAFWAKASLIALFSLLASLIVLMACTLRRRLAVTVFDYANILLASGLVFVSAFAAVMIVFFIRSADGFSVAELLDCVIAFPRRFSYYAVFVLCAVSVALGISNIALIRHEGFRPRNALSVLFAAVYLGGTGAVYAFTGFVEHVIIGEQVAQNDRLFLFLRIFLPLFAVLVLCYFECMLVGTCVMGWKAAHRTPAYDKDFVIILGCRIDRKGGLLPLLKGRVNRAVKFAWAQEIATGKPMKYVPSGGKGRDEIMSEGSAMELYLLSHGAEPYEVFPEKESTDTYENMLFSKRLIDRLKPDAKIAFATTNYHILRSGILARKAGFDAEGIAGDTKWYFWPNGFLREYIALLAMHRKTHVAAVLVIAAASAAVALLTVLTAIG